MLGATMSCRTLVGTLMTVLGTLMIQVAAAAPLDNLKGRSIVLSWHDHRIVAPLNSTKTGGVTVDQASHVTVYVSTQARFFSQFDRQTGLGKTSAFALSNQNVMPRKDGWDWSYSGGTLLGTEPLITGARRVEVHFGPGNRSCTLRVLTGKPAGDQQPIIFRSTSDHRQMRLISIQVYGESCAVSSGNAFQQAN